MAIIQGNAKQGSTRGFYPKVINGSLRFNDDDSAYLTWTPATAGNRKTWTWSGWVKRAGTGTRQWLFSTGTSGSNYGHFMIDSDDKLYYVQEATTLYRIGSNQKLRDHSAWYHIMFVMDTTNATADDRMRYYVNGVRVDADALKAQPPQNTDMVFNQAGSHSIGKNNYSTNYTDAYLANVHFIDGQALTASDFGETKNGVWVAKDYAGTFGTNGFYLTFEDDTQVEAFNTVLYRGNGGTQSITGVGFQPDLVWVKERDDVVSHLLTDSVRGADKTLSSDLTASEVTGSRFVSFDSDGFTVGATGASNGSADNYVAWCWKAGDSNVSNTDGTITSTVRANDTYGFSIVSYTGNSTVEQSVGHGLSATPDFIVIKNRDATTDWQVYHSSVTTADNIQLELNKTGGTGSVSNLWDVSNMTSTTFGVGSNNTTNGSNDMIAYCWSETTGYSKFGSYAGGTNPQTITTTFKPAFVLIKAVSGSSSPSTQHWYMFDNTRDVSGDNLAKLYPNLSNAESTAADNQIEFLDTGFTLKSTNDGTNASGNTYIYAAFADTREAAFWLDQSGNDNDWQPVNLDHNDTVADSPTDNFCVMNAISGYGGTLSDGNLAIAMDAGSTRHSNFGMSSGQWYWEVTINSSNWRIGVTNGDNFAQRLGGTDTILFEFGRGSTSATSGAENNPQSTKSYDNHTPNITSGVYGFALDADAKTCDVYFNGTLAYTFDTFTIDGPYFFGIDRYNSSPTTSHTVNFGQQPFKYDPPE